VSDSLNIGCVAAHADAASPIVHKESEDTLKIGRIYVPADTLTVYDTVILLDSLYLAGSAVPSDSLSCCEKRDTVHRRIFSLSTNIPYDITYVPGYGLTSIPSFSLEFCPDSTKFTFGADVEWPMWRHPQEHRYFQINNITLWARYYFKPEVERVNGLYLLANINAAQYGIGFNANQGWEGEGLGASLGVGYKLYLGKHVFLDAGAAFGYFYSWYDPYVWGNDATGRYYYDYYGNPDEFVPRNKRLQWLGPTRVYISVGIDLFNRKDRKRR